MDSESLSICLSLVNIRSEIDKPSLIINTICIWMSIFFVVFTGADDNRLQNYKIAKFTVFVRSLGEDGGAAVGGGVLNLSFESLRVDGAIKIKQVQILGI